MFSRMTRSEGKKKSFVRVGWSWFTQPTWVPRLTRLLAVFTSLTTIDQGLQRLGVDLLKQYQLSRSFTVSAILNIWLILELFITTSSKTALHSDFQNLTSDPQHQFSNATIALTEDLFDKGKMKTVIALRKSLSHFFHLIGNHETRTRLGEIALRASIEIKDGIVLAEIYIDDLGWTRHLAGEDDAAVRNIKRGLEILTAQAADTISGRLRKQLLFAKGHRHLAMLAHDLQDSLSHLTRASEALKTLHTEPQLPDTFQEEILRDEAQILHAKSFLLAKSLGIESRGAIPAHEQEKAQVIANAIEDVKRADAIFAQVGDLERQVKNLYLLGRLYYAVGNQALAQETTARRDQIRKVSGIGDAEEHITQQKGLQDE